MLELRGDDGADRQPRLWHDRHHHRARNAARAGLRMGRSRRSRSTISPPPARSACSAALADGIVKKLLTPITWPLPSYFGPFAELCPKGKSLLIAMIAKPSLESFKALLGAKGEIIHEAPFDESPDKTPIYEYTWNHTTLQVLKHDRGFTYQQCLFPHDRSARRASPRWSRCLATRSGIISSSSASAAASRRARCRWCGSRRASACSRSSRSMRSTACWSPTRMSTRSRTAAATSAPTRDQLGFKREADPYNLLNPGKMRSYEAVARMKVLYVYCHPLPESFHAAIRVEALAGLKRAGHRGRPARSLCREIRSRAERRGPAALSRREPQQGRAWSRWSRGCRRRTRSSCSFRPGASACRRC